MIDCKVCIHYDCCCGWTSKEVIDSLGEDMEEGACRECNYYEPQKIGKWIDISIEPDRVHWKCSSCGKETNLPNYDKANYCFNCGAKMMDN